MRTSGRAALAVLERKGYWLRLMACFLSALNNQLRTGADKGNPTVYLKQSIVMAGDGVDTM